MRARDLQPGHVVPTGRVQSVELHESLGLVLVSLNDGRAWVYHWNDQADALEWWIGWAGEGPSFTRRFGPWATREEAERAKLHNQLRGRVFPLPVNHSRRPY